MDKLQFWGYVHTSGTLQVKRYFSKRDIKEAEESPFCEKVFGPFEVKDMEEARKLANTISKNSLLVGIEEGNKMLDLFKKGAEGAIPNNTRVRKVLSEEGDSTPNGSEGIVVGSSKVPDMEIPGPNGEINTYMYMVSWDYLSSNLVFVVDYKIEEIK